MVSTETQPANPQEFLQNLVDESLELNNEIEDSNNVKKIDHIREGLGKIDKEIDSGVKMSVESLANIIIVIDYLESLYKKENIAQGDQFDYKSLKEKIIKMIKESKDAPMVFIAEERLRKISDKVENDKITDVTELEDILRIINYLESLYKKENIAQGDQFDYKSLKEKIIRIIKESENTSMILIAEERLRKVSDAVNNNEITDVTELKNILRIINYLVSLYKKENVVLGDQFDHQSLRDSVSSKIKEKEEGSKRLLKLVAQAQGEREGEEGREKEVADSEAEVIRKRLEQEEQKREDLKEKAERIGKAENFINDYAAIPGEELENLNIDYLNELLSNIAILQDTSKLNEKQTSELNELREEVQGRIKELTEKSQKQERERQEASDQKKMSEEAKKSRRDKIARKIGVRELREQKRQQEEDKLLNIFLRFFKRDSEKQPKTEQEGGRKELSDYLELIGEEKELSWDDLKSIIDEYDWRNNLTHDVDPEVLNYDINEARKFISALDLEEIQSFLKSLENYNKEEFTNEFSRLLVLEVGRIVDKAEEIKLLIDKMVSETEDLSYLEGVQRSFEGAGASEMAQYVGEVITNRRSEIIEAKKEVEKKKEMLKVAEEREKFIKEVDNFYVQLRKAVSDAEGILDDKEHEELSKSVAILLNSMTEDFNLELQSLDGYGELDGYAVFDKGYVSHEIRDGYTELSKLIVDKKQFSPALLLLLSKLEQWDLSSNDESDKKIELIEKNVEAFIKAFQSIDDNPNDPNKWVNEAKLKGAFDAFIDSLIRLKIIQKVAGEYLSEKGLLKTLIKLEESNYTKEGLVDMAQNMSDETTEGLEDQYQSNLPYDYDNYLTESEDETEELPEKITEFIKEYRLQEEPVKDLWKELSKNGVNESQFIDLIKEKLVSQPA